MHAFEFTDEEVEVLREMLRHGIGEINTEVFRTDTHNFKELLKHRQAVMQQTLDKLTVPAEQAWQ